MLGGEPENENYILLQEAHAGHVEEKWKDIRQSDRFFQRVYDYYAGSGFACIILARLRDLIVLAFMVLFSYFLVVCVEWAKLTSDANEQHDTRLLLMDYVSLSASVHPIAAVCLAMFCLYWLWLLYVFLRDIPNLFEMKSLFARRLKVEEGELATIQWKEIIRSIVEAQQRGEIRIHDGNVSALEIANRIMRRENYIIALMNKEKIPLSLPCLMGERKLLTTGLEFNVVGCINNFMERNSTRLRRGNVAELGAELRRDFIVLGVVNLILTPFIFAFLLLYSFFKYAAEVHKSPAELGARQWTRYAKWRLREFNELPHVFEARMNKTYSHANEYVDQFPPGSVGIIASLVNFVAGSIVAVVLIIAFLDESMSRAVDVTPDHSLVWCGAVATTVFAITRAVIPKPHAIFDPEAALLKVAQHTHYLPKEWRGQAHHARVFDRFTAWFRFRFIAFLLELVGVFLTPLLLLFAVSGASYDIVRFLTDFSISVPGIGSVCSFARFDFTNHSNLAQTGEEERFSADYKMEQSFLNFKANHPESHGIGSARVEDVLDALAQGDAENALNSLSMSLTVGEVPLSELAPVPMSPAASGNPAASFLANPGKYDADARDSGVEMSPLQDQDRDNANDAPFAHDPLDDDSPHDELQSVIHKFKNPEW